MSDSSLVREFNQAAQQACPDRPEAMCKRDVEFLVKMMLDEMMELMATVHYPDDAKNVMIDMIENSKDIPKTEYPDTQEGKIDKIADQADALVDAYYYSLNAACKRGINISKVFQIVHAANMAKMDPTTGMFIKREDGKILKPPGWQPPDVRGEILRQSLEGSFV